MTIRIQIEHGQDAGKTWRLARPGLYVLGRIPQSSIRVLDMKASKQHCVIALSDEDDVVPTLADANSSHGTFLNDAPVEEPSALKAGDRIKIGMSILRVLADGEADAEARPLKPLPRRGGARDDAAAEDAAGEETPPPEKSPAGTPEAPRRSYPPDALVGREVAGYRVLEKIGQGGMGSVYRAEQISLHREVALKVLSERFTKDKSFVDQFVNEARAAGALNHPNVVQVYDVGQHDGRYFFSMEYVAGGSLEERLHAEPAEWTEALNWLIDAANALIFANKRGILHRDVKPDNLMLSEDGSAKLCDLGLAKKSESADLLAAGIIGTPAFIAPEAIRRKQEVDIRADLYSLGCSFYRILTGENPYPGQTVKEILLGHLNKPVPHVVEKAPGVPRDLDAVVYRLMQKAPEERYETPEDLLQALDRIRVQHGLEAHGLRPATKRPLIIAGVVAVLAIGAVAYAVTRPDTVIREELPPEEIAAREAAERAAAQGASQAYVGEARADLADLQVEKATGNLRDGANWRNPAWPGLAERFEDLAATLRGHEDYGERPEVEQIAAQAAHEATEIKDYVALRRSLEKDIADARTARTTALREALQQRKSEIEEAVGKGAWVQAATLADPEDVARVVEPYLALKVQDVLPDSVPKATREKFAGDLLLDPDEHVAPLVTEAFPGDPAGSEMLARAVAAANTAHDEAMAAAREAQARADHEGYGQAIATLEAYVGGIPEPGDATPSAMRETLERHRQEARDLADDVESARMALLAADIEHDRAVFFEVIRALRAPGGLLFRFALDEAQQMAEQARDAMRYPAYQELAATWLGDVRALRALRQQAIDTFAAGWADDRVDVDEGRGRTKTVRVREVSVAGVRAGLGGDATPWAQLEVDWLVGELFHDDEGQPRFPLEGEAARGLAVLAEMAVDYDAAARHYQSYLARLDPEALDVQKALRRRLGGLQRERVAGESWRRAIANAREVQRILDAHDPAVIGEEEFWERENREDLLAREGELGRLLQEARGAKATLEEPEYAATIWGSAIREDLPAQARYAGEPDIAPVEEPGGATPPGGDEDGTADGR